MQEHGHKLKQEYTFSGDESGKSQQPTVDRKQLCHHWTSAVQRTVSEYCTLAANTFPIATAEALVSSGSNDDPGVNQQMVSSAVSTSCSASVSLAVAGSVVN